MLSLLPLGREIKAKEAPTHGVDLGCVHPMPSKLLLHKECLCIQISKHILIHVEADVLIMAATLDGPTTLIMVKAKTI